MSDTPTSRLPILLIVSLVLNGLLIGLIVGGSLSKRGHTPPQVGNERTLMRGLQWITPEAEQSELREAMRDAYIEARPKRRILRQARRDLRQAMTTEPYDAEAVGEAFLAVQKAEAEARASLQVELARQLGRLTPEQRATLMRNLEQSRPPREKRGRRVKREQQPPQE